jgi:very-short-patch-repair endonuclease
MEKWILKYGKENILQAIISSKSYEMACKKLGVSNGPNHRNNFKQFIQLNQIDISHFDRSWSQKAQKKYFSFQKSCLICNNIFTCKPSKKGEQQTCSKKCSNIFSSSKRMTEKTKEKIKKSLSNYNLNRKTIGINTIKNLKITRLCPVCEKEYIPSAIKVKTCSISCGNKLKCTPEYRKKLSDLQKKRVKEGRHNGWSTRNVASYPEKYFQKKLSALGFNYKFNYPIKKKDLGVNESCNYFLDFYFEDKKLDLEIDGKQHFYPDRVESDKVRDDLLNKYGIKVFRIKWVNPISEGNTELLNKQIDNFLNVYNNL